MVNRAQARAALRDLTNDATSPQLWNDSALNAALTDATARYGAWRPLGAASTLAVAAGVTSYALPADVIPDTHFELYDASWNRIPPANPAHLAPGPSTASGLELAWWQHAGQIFLTRIPTDAADWTIQHWIGRACPTDDVTELPIIPGEEPIVYQLAATTLYERRAVDDAKRGDRNGRSSQHLADYHRMQAKQLMNAYRRRARGGSTLR